MKFTFFSLFFFNEKKESESRGRITSRHKKHACDPTDRGFGHDWLKQIG